MDRRQRKTREAIFSAFIRLLAEKHFGQITVGEIIEQADVGRATFYAHFETKDFLLKELCEDLFCHVFDAAGSGHPQHRHLFQCDGSGTAFLHLFRHLMKNDQNILTLLSCPNNELFLRYFKDQLRRTARDQQPLFAHRKDPQIPEELWIDHIAATFADTLRWWIDNGRQESPETLYEYFCLMV